MGVSTTTIETITCDDCGSIIPKDNYTKEYVVVKQHKEKSHNLDHEWWEIDVYRYDYHYKCTKCNKQGWTHGENKYK